MANHQMGYLFLLLRPFVLPLLLHVIIFRPRPVKIAIKNRHVFNRRGSSGIGRTGCISLDKLEEANHSFRIATGIHVLVFAADVRDYYAISRAVNEAGGIDVLIVNEGVFVPQELVREAGGPARSLYVF